MSSQQRAVVVGAGLVGAAAARRLSERGLSVTCIGPVTGEPPFSSHDDSSRLTRVLDGDPVWARLASRSIAEYAELEAASGEQFHWPVGVLWSATTPAPLAQLAKVGPKFDVEIGVGLGGWDEALSVYAAPEGVTVHPHDARTGSGWIHRSTQNAHRASTARRTCRYPIRA